MPLFVPFTGLLIAIVPIVLMAWINHATPEDRTFMWELQYDQFYYAANARNMIEGGFHLAHANPYDPRPQAPRVYSHLFTVLVAAVAMITGMEPLYAYFLIRPALGVILAMALWYFLSAVVTDMSSKKPVFFALMLTGGVTVIFALARAGSTASLGGHSFWDVFGQTYTGIEELSGDWLCNIFRNYFYTPELLYHSLWYLALGSYLRGRFVQCALLTATELYAHPFTGPELALIIFIMATVDVFTADARGRRSLILLAASVAACTALFGGYVAWLNRDPGHQVLQETWRRFAAIIPLYHLPVIYGPWLLSGLAGAAALAFRFRRDAVARCLIVQAGVVLILSNHHMLTQNYVQPAHFTRGHLFTALVLLTARAWPDIRRAAPWTGRLHVRIIPILIAVLMLDNAAYTLFVRVRSQDPPMTLHRDQAAVIKYLQTIPERQFVATDGNMGVMIPVLTPHRALLGHKPNTPAYDNAYRLLTLWAHTGRRDLFDAYPDISMACLSRSVLPLLRDDPDFQAGWNLVFETPEYALFRRTGGPGR